MKLKFLLIIFIGLTPILRAQQGLIVSKAMVVSAREEASQIGVDIMKKGGNAFDAMVATELALAVARPISRARRPAFTIKLSSLVFRKKFKHRLVSVPCGS